MKRSILSQELAKQVLKAAESDPQTAARVAHVISCVPELPEGLTPGEQITWISLNVPVNELRRIVKGGPK